jgi:hypothetical protein
MQMPAALSMHNFCTVIPGTHAWPSGMSNQVTSSKQKQPYIHVGSTPGAPRVSAVCIMWGAGRSVTHLLPWWGRGAMTGALRPTPRGTSSSAYKYKSHDRLRSFYPIESINLLFSYFSPYPNFPNLVLFFAHLDGVQGHFGWPADLKTTLDLRAPTGSLPSLRF